MYELDKEKFGSFIAQLRKEQGMTQRELAGKLAISDKAVSKWETGVSIPDTALLIPLGEVLGVTVTELLMGKRMEEPMEPEDVEGVVQRAISYTQDPRKRAWQQKGPWGWIYAAALAVGLWGLWLNARLGPLPEVLVTSALLSAIFGAWFCFLIRTELPKFYDENRIGGVFDGVFRMNLPGLTFNNRNWPYIIRAGRLWAVGNLALFPLLTLGLRCWVPGFWESYQTNMMLAVTMGTLFIPMYIAGWRHR